MPHAIPIPALGTGQRLRLLPALLVLALHLLFIALLHQAMRPAQPAAATTRTVWLRLPKLTTPVPPERDPPPAAPQPPQPPLLRVPLPEFSVPGSSESLATPLPTDAAASSGSAPPPGGTATAASAPLNLSLPAPGQRTRLPAIAEQMRHDPRANSPMPSAEQRMAAALGAKGWTVIDLGDGAKKVMGPFGECAIVRPSMVDGIAGHPHAGLLPSRSFPCGGVEKGSLVHARPHERRP